MCILRHACRVLAAVVCSLLAALPTKHVSVSAAHTDSWRCASTVLLQVCKSGMTNARKIWLTRHGESVYNQQGLIGGDSPLSMNGQVYAEMLPDVILSRLPNVSLCYLQGPMPGLHVNRIPCRAAPVVATVPGGCSAMQLTCIGMQAVQRTKACAARLAVMLVACTF